MMWQWTGQKRHGSRAGSTTFQVLATGDKCHP